MIFRVFYSIEDSIRQNNGSFTIYDQSLIAKRDEENLLFSWLAIISDYDDRSEQVFRQFEICLIILTATTLVMLDNV